MQAIKLTADSGDEIDVEVRDGEFFITVTDNDEPEPVRVTAGLDRETAVLLCNLLFDMTDEGEGDDE